MDQESHTSMQTTTTHPVRRTALVLIGIFVLQVLLATQTFHLPLARSGTLAADAHRYALVWQAIHVALLTVILPASFILILGRLLVRRRLRRWNAITVAAAWVGLAALWGLWLFADLVVHETILPINHEIPLTALLAICIVCTGAIAAATIALPFVRRSPVGSQP